MRTLYTTSSNAYAENKFGGIRCGCCVGGTYEEGDGGDGVVTKTYIEQGSEENVTESILQTGVDPDGGFTTSLQTGSTTFYCEGKAILVCGGLSIPECPPIRYSTKFIYTQKLNFRSSATEPTQKAFLAWGYKSIYNKITRDRGTIYPPPNTNVYGPKVCETVFCWETGEFTKVSRGGGMVVITGKPGPMRNLKNWDYNPRETKFFMLGTPTAKPPLPKYPHAFLLGSETTSALSTTGFSSDGGETYQEIWTKSGSWETPIFVFGNLVTYLHTGLLKHMPFDGTSTTYKPGVAFSGPRRVPALWFANNSGKWTTGDNFPKTWSKPDKTFPLSRSCFRTWSSLRCPLSGPPVSCNEQRVELGPPIAFPMHIGATGENAKNFTLTIARYKADCGTYISAETVQVADDFKRATCEIKASRGSLEKPWIDGKGTSVQCSPALFRISTARLDAYGNWAVHRHPGPKPMTYQSGKSVFTGASFWKEGKPYCRIGGRDIYGTLRYIGTIKPKTTMVGAVAPIHAIRHGQPAQMLPDSPAPPHGEEAYGSAILGPLNPEMQVTATFTLAGSAGGSAESSDTALGWLVATCKPGDTQIGARAFFGLVENDYNFKTKVTTIENSGEYSAIFDQSVFKWQGTTFGYQGGRPADYAKNIYDAPLIAHTPDTITSESGYDTHFSNLLGTISPDATSSVPGLGHPGTTPWRTIDAYNPQIWN